MLVATLTGIPISTTHSLAGALLGAGLVSAGGEVNSSSLGSKIFLPLIFSPAIAVVLTLPLAGILSIASFLVISHIK